MDHADQSRITIDEHDYSAVEDVIRDVVPPSSTRRTILRRAGTVLAAAGGSALVASIAAPAAHASTGGVGGVARIKTVLASFEVFGVTFISEAVRRAPGTPSEQFLSVLKSANTEEFDHLQALKRIGAEPLSQRIWVPEHLFGDGGAGLFRSIEKDEDIEISAYLVGVTAFAHAGDTAGARLCAEALGTESVHRALARFAQGEIKHQPEVPNNRGFEAFLHRSAGDALRALEALGVGFGKVGSKPGRFYEFPGDPRENGTGLPVTANTPS